MNRAIIKIIKIIMPEIVKMIVLNDIVFCVFLLSFFSWFSILLIHSSAFLILSMAFMNSWFCMFWFSSSIIFSQVLNWFNVSCLFVLFFMSDIFCCSRSFSFVKYSNVLKMSIFAGFL